MNKGQYHQLIFYMTCLHYFEVIPSENPHTLTADEILANEILIDDQSSVIDTNMYMKLN